MAYGDLELIGPVGVRRFKLGHKCQINQGHTHNYDHVTFVDAGRVLVTFSFMLNGVRVEGETKEFGAGEHLVILKDVFHTFKQTSDEIALFKCVFSHRDFDGIVVESYVGNDAAYV